MKTINEVKMEKDEHRKKAFERLEGIAYWMRKSSISYKETHLKEEFKKVIKDYMKSV